MAGSVLVDTGFLVALLSDRDQYHQWAVTTAEQYPPPWKTCEAVLNETFHLLETAGAPALSGLLRNHALSVPFNLAEHLDPVLRLIDKYADLPASLADAALVRMTETLQDPVVLTTDSDFRIYRRHGRQVVPGVTP